MRWIARLLTIAFAQGFYVTRVQHAFIGKAGVDETPTCAARDREGYVYVGGFVRSSSVALPDGWLVCLTPTGEVRWMLTPGGMAADHIEDLWVGDSILYFCGYSGSSLSHPEELPVERRADFWVGAVEKATGTLLWQRRWGGPFIDMALSLCGTSYHTLLIAGLSWHDTLSGVEAVVCVLNERTGEVLHRLNWGRAPSLIRRIRPFSFQRSFICIGEQDHRPFIAEIDYLGQIHWRVSLQFHRFPSQLHALHITSDGRIIVGGRYGNRWSIAAFTPSGQIIWEKLWDRSNMDGTLQALTEGPEGILYAVGWQYSEELVSSEQRGGEDIWLAALTKEGHLLWERGFGGPSDERGVAIVPAGDTLFLITAKENRFSDPSPHKDAWLVILRAVPCSKIPLRLRTDAPSLQEKAGTPIRFWVELPSSYAVRRVIWDFGDGGTAEGSSVEHIYLLPGFYSIQVRIDFKYGCQEVYPPSFGLKISRP